MPGAEFTPDERAALALLYAELGATLLSTADLGPGPSCLGCGLRPAGSFQGRITLCAPCSHAEAFLTAVDNELRTDLGWGWGEFRRYLRKYGKRPPRPTRLDW